MLKPEMRGVNDIEGKAVPRGFPPLIDTHVHVFPHRIFAAVQGWFDEHAWPIRYRMRTEEIFDFLLSSGIRHIVALQYAHKPGIARLLNTYLAEKCKGYKGRVTGMATVFPGEDQAAVILQEAFDSGLNGLKLHVHVQCFDMNAPYMDALYECCRLNGKPVVIHASREPKSEAYQCDPYEICSAEKLEAVLKNFPGLKVCVPHLGFDETAAYKKLIETYDTLWLDTTMVITDYLPMEHRIALDRYRPDRIMYGSDFPNIPYAWDREIKALQAMPLPKETLEKISFKNAVEFFSLDL